MRKRRHVESHRKQRSGLAVWAGLVGVVFIVGICRPVDAEVIIRKDGRKIEGQIIQEDENYLRVRTSYGTFRIRKADIKEVTGRRPISDNEREGHEELAAGNHDAALVKFQAALSEATTAEDKKAIGGLIAKVKAIIQAREEARFKSQLTSANQAIKEQRFGDAKQELTDLLLANQDDPTATGIIRRKMGEVHMAEAQYYKDQINYAEAAEAYREAINLMPDAPEPRLEMAALLKDRGGADLEVIGHYVDGIERALRTRSEADLIDSYYELGKVYLRAAGASKEPNPEYLNRAIEALLVVMRHRADGYRFAAKQLEDAFAELSKTNYDMAAMTGMLLATLEINPNAQKVRWILAEAYSKTREFQKAIDQLLIIEKNAKESGESFPPEFYYRLGLAYMALPRADRDKALDAFETEIVQNKRNYLALIRAAELNSNATTIDGTYDKALNYCKQAIALRKERPEAYLMAANVHMRRNFPGDTLQARRYLKTALNLKDDFHQARIRLAELEILRQREAEVANYDEALALLFRVQMDIEKIGAVRRTDEDNKAYAESILWVAEIENDKKNHRQAADLVDKALKVYADFPHAYRVKGDIHQQLDEYDRAKKSYLKAVEMDPGTPETYMQLGILCQTRLNEYEEAIKYFDAYLQNNGTEQTRVQRWIKECRKMAASGTEVEIPSPIDTPTTGSPDTATTATATGP